jgi:RNA polymerase sigma-70 factor (ECF subfamily)
MPGRESVQDSDAALIRACLEGAPGAFERLVEDHRRVVFHAIRSALDRTSARDDAELQDEAFVRVFSTVAADGMKVLRNFQGRSRLATFLVVVARRVTLRTLAELRPRIAGQPAAAPLERGVEAPDPGPGPAERAEREEVRALVRASVAGLSPRDALAIQLFYEEGLGHREIGSVIGVPVTHVGQILARAREKLRTRLGRLGLGTDSPDGLS